MSKGCERCFCRFEYTYNYCPYCGAKYIDPLKRKGFLDEAIEKTLKAISTVLDAYKLSKEYEESINQVSEFADKREELRLLLEGKDGFYAKYYNAIQHGNISDMVEVVNKTMSKIFDLFKE